MTKVRIGSRACGAVLMMLMSRMPASDMCRVRGIGVALMRQNVDFGAQLFQELLVAHAESLLLVDDNQAEILELDIALHQPVRADDDVDLAVRSPSSDLALLLLGARRESISTFTGKGAPAAGGTS